MTLEMTNGVSRLVFLIGNYAIKIANFKHSHLHFLQGCYANWSERDYYKFHILVKYEGNKSTFVAPSYFCSWFGLIQIQARCEPNTAELTASQRDFFNSVCSGDFKKQNFGFYQGKLVCLDYP